MSELEDFGVPKKILFDLKIKNYSFFTDVVFCNKFKFEKQFLDILRGFLEKKTLCWNNFKSVVCMSVNGFISCIKLNYFSCTVILMPKIK